MSEPVDPREQFGEHGEWDALAVGWALSALDPEDEERFAEHLPGCARCTATVREALYTVADMAYALPDEAPPASLKARIMAAVAAEPRTPDAVPPPSPGAVSAPGSGAIPPPASAAEPGVPERLAPAEPEPEEEWELGEPYPGSPGDGIDWFAKPPRSAQPPPPGPLAAPAAEPTIGPGSPDLPADDSGALARRLTDEPAPADERVARYEAAARDERVTHDEPAAAGEPAPEYEDAVGAERVPGGEPVDDERVAVGGEPELVPSGGETADVVPLAPRRRRLGRRIGIGVAAAAVLALIAGLLVSNVRLRDQQSDLRQVVAQRDTAIEQLTANGPAKVAALTANGQPSPDRRATLVVRGDHVEIIIESLGPTTGNETYWLWTLRCDTPQPTDLKPIRGFTVTQSDFSVRDIGSDPEVAGAPCFAISSEEGTATPKAPRQVVAVGQAR